MLGIKHEMISKRWKNEFSKKFHRIQKFKALKNRGAYNDLLVNFRRFDCGQLFDALGMKNHFQKAKSR